MKVVIELEEAPSAEDVSEIGKRLVAFNETKAGPEKYERVFFAARGVDGKLVGALLGEIFWDTLHIHIIWTDEQFRSNGIASELLFKSEKHALNKGCYLVLLDTFDFQAPSFYEKRNYQLTGQVDNYPKGHTKYYYKKTLTTE
ncbi:GNAT family N-acetyltransferase [Dyadobacter sp. CY312]|uniref:GNAT family N-acetyltransferase n=1 Tax=Dyadobacter sp. CY312 TaxID=2907303 RepID=UPI001F1D4EBC|nr:GNAT family N-acetyltransferase [Dyadobacter sp. CY312]MCE7039955.1 GNAT family N-acetyltransferase [Dyadobacter sp. CY312]